MMIACCIVTDGRGNEVAWNNLCSLVNQLVKRMLSVGSRFTPDHWSCRIIHFIAVAVNILTIAFHISLLKICCKAMHVLIVGEDGFCSCFKEIAIPYTDKCHQHRYIFLKLSFPEMFIGFMSSFQ